ncbi:Retrotransposon gag protein [Gossypium australe]|uniref:Retrotransposon gag protein n=1 Tax=Gossypium australe TaxID=47621 RepID=A0A5B6WS50_9ROSI|nr:Retrotransposon gag protein [Gossypium australe]
MFYNGLDVNARSILDKVAEGALMNIKYEDEHDRYQQIMDTLNRIESSSTSALSIYGGDKPLFPYINNTTEDVKYIENRCGNPYSNTYNPSRRDHPNLRWSETQRGGNSFNHIKNTNYQPPFLQKP